MNGYDENDDIFDGLEPENVVEGTPGVSGDDGDFFSQKDAAFDPFIGKLLEAKGFVDGKATILKDDGSEEELNFFDLSEEERLELLTAPVENDNEFSSEEIEFLNTLKENNLSLNEYLQQYRNQILTEAGSVASPSYDIDNYDDEELFILDLQAKFELTEEELANELETALKNKPIFDKKIAKLREEYRELEKQYNENIKTEEYNNFVNTVSTAANAISEFHGIVLEDSDKIETLKYLTNLDQEGLSAFSRDLRDPKKIYEVAWYLRWGKDAFKALESAYEEEISKLRKR